MTSQIPVIISFDEKRLKAVAADKTLTLDLPPVTPEETGRLLGERWSEEGLPREALTVLFPRKQAIVKTLTLPASGDAEIRDMLPLQASRLTPLSIDEIATGYERIETMPDQQIRINLVVVRRDDLQDLLAPLRAAGLHPARVTLDCDPAPQSLHGGGLNLLTGAEIRQGTRLQRRRRIRWVASVAGLLLALGGMVAGVLYHAKIVRLRQATQALAAEDASIKELRRMDEALASSRGGQEGGFLQILAEINRLAPPRTAVRSISYQAGRSLTIDATAFSHSDAVHVLEALQKSPLFKRLEMRGSNSVRLYDHDLVEFSLWSPL